MWQWRNELIEKIKTMGPVATVTVNIAVWLITYVVVVYGHKLLFRFGWLHSSSDLTQDDVGCAVFTGLIVGLWEWSDRDKKRQMQETKRQGLDATMI